ncbi:MAG: tyrosine-type recombinase/integrase [Thermoplasmatales archaeon]|nr:tyrosine-type recombinase/integrase [Thermoplasmatales archaeon]
MEKYEQYYQKKLDEIKNLSHKKDILEFIRIRESVNKIKPSTKANDITAIYHLSEFLKNKPFNKANQDDLMDFEKGLKQRHKEGTIFQEMTKIKSFYKFIYDKEKYKISGEDQKEITYPNCVKWIKGTKPGGLPITNILDEKQIKKLLKSCSNTREQVILTSLLDGGLRVGEFVNLRIKNVKFDKTLGYYFTLPVSKTEQRKVQLFLIPGSTIYIREYLNHHPRREDEDAFFIYSNCKKLKYEQMPYTQLTEDGVNKIVKRVGRIAGINNIYPHYLRHMSATMCCARGFTEPMLRSRFGWSKSSNMPSHYVHLVSADTDNFIKKILGIKDEDEIVDNTLANIICWNCSTENPCDFKYCGKCSANLKPKKEELTMSATETGLSIQDMIKDKEFMMKMMNLMAVEWEKNTRRKISQ